MWVGMDRILPYVLPYTRASAPMSIPREESKWSQITTLLFAVLMSELPVKDSLLTWAEQYGISVRVILSGEGDFPSPKPQTRQSPETRQKRYSSFKTVLETKSPLMQERVITSCF